jgi:hypothetical protein
MKITRAKLVAGAVFAIGILIAVFVLPVIGETRHQLNYVAQSPKVRDTLRAVATNLLSAKAVIPSVQRESEGIVAEIFVASDGKVIVLGRSGWLGFIAIPKVTPAGVAWQCHSILDKLVAWEVRCGE